MKSKLGRGNGPLGLLNYIFQIGKGVGAGCPTILSTNLSSSTPREMSRELRNVFRLRPDVKRPLLHVSLSLVPGEKVGEETWHRLIGRYLKKMGFPPDTPFTSGLHHDTKCEHPHLAISRVSLSGKVWLGRWEVRRSIEVCQELEREFGLRLTPGLHGDDDADAKARRPDRVADSQSIINANRVKSAPRIDTAEMARVLLQCAARSADLPSFTAAAAARGVKVLPNKSETTGYVSGLSIISPGRKKPVALSAATKNKLSWPKLLKAWDRNTELAEAAQRFARDAVTEADSRAVDRVAAGLLRDGTQTASDTSKSKPEALLPSAITKEAHAMARHLKDPNDQLGFLTEPPPPRPAGRIDDTSLVVQTDDGKREAGERMDRERASAQAQIEDELKSATKAQLERLRVALTSELHADDDEAIEQMLNRLLRLVVRLATLGQVVLVLPHSEGERRVLAARHTIQLVDAEILRRADVAAQPVSSPELPRPQPEPATLRIVRAHDARRQSPADRDRDAMDRGLDAKRERNRT